MKTLRTAVEVEVDAKRVTVSGERVADAAVRAAIDEAGYDIAVHTRGRCRPVPCGVPS